MYFYAMSTLLRSMQMMNACPNTDLPRLKDLDWPTCLDYFEFDYYDIVYNESTYMKTFSRPFPEFHHIMEFELRSDKIPCSEEYAFITRVR